MKILMFIESGGPGGAERVVLELAQGLKEAGHEVELAGLRTGWFTEKAKELGFTHHLMQNNSSFSLPFQIANLARHYDLIHSHLLDSNFYCSLASKIYGKAHIATEHGDVHHSQTKRYAKLKMRTAQMLGTKFCAVSNYTRTKMQDLGIKNATVIGNPFTELKINQTREQIRTSLNIDSKERIWIHVANLRPVKDQSTLLRAVAESKTSYKLLIVGDGPLMFDLKSLAESLKINDRVLFLGHRHDIGDLLNASNGFVLTSISEAMPMSLLEAGSLGLALVGSNVGGIPEVIKNSEYLFEAGDYKTLAEILDRHPVRKDESIIAFINDNFSRSKVVEKYLEQYSQILFK